MKNLLWSGPRESDIAGLDSRFCASTTIFGSNHGNNRAFSKDAHLRVNHNQPDSIPDEYFNDKIAEWIERYPDLNILYYNPLYSEKLLPSYQERVIGRNNLSLLKLLDSKSEMRRIANKSIPIVPFQKVENKKQLQNALHGLSSGVQYILQENNSSGGYGTHIVNKDSIDAFLYDFSFDKNYFVSPYIEKSTSINVHCVIFDDVTLVFPGSIQLVKVVNHRIIYMGADYITYQTLSDLVKQGVNTSAKSFCEILRGMGYRGVLGIDFLIFEGQPYFLEVNARFQASTPLLNKALLSHNLPSMQEFHMAAFEGRTTLPPTEILESLSVPYSMAVYTADNFKKDIGVFDCLKSNEAVDIVLDGYDPSEPILEGAHLFHTVFQTNLSSVNADGSICIYENLYDIDDSFSRGVYAKDPLHVKISLLNQGVTISEKAKDYLKKQGEIRHAVFSAVDLTILDGLQVNCPSDVKFVSLSPWSIDLSEGNELKLYYRNHEISTVTLDMADPYSKLHTRAGVPYQSISFWATDRMRIHHTISCVFKKRDIGCRFCEVLKSDTLCDLADIYEVIDFYLERNNSFRHFLIGGGSEPLDLEEKRITEIVKYIRARSDKSIYLMCLPPQNLSVLKTWHDAGVNEIAFNLELFDRLLAEKYMPGKGRIPLAQYMSALEKAVTLWGKDGNVRTLFIVGLESTSSILQGIEEVASRGIMPILSVYRALKGTETENIVPPMNNWLLDLFKEGERICQRYHLHLGPSCSACQNNTLSLPFYMLQ